ncbi:uncharacterized protein LOC121379847 [Gigantopelta aegis]|uniref:uncharacterized protein LOC121379847 n=1 Tax=Gigantopelta aegis TaxID=1735272 RepID=UPI001B889B7D|nr:uncharacterized protein LOC121379847 [Gigantopelta aegis]
MSRLEYGSSGDAGADGSRVLFGGDELFDHVANKSLDMAVQLRDVDFNCSCCIIFQITVANKSLDMAVQLRDVDFNCSCCIIFQITVANKSLDMAVQLRDVDFNCSCCIIFQITVANKSLDMAVQLRDVDFNCSCCIIFQITVANKSLDMAIQLRDVDFNCSCCIIFQITVANKSLDMAVQLRDVDFNCSCCIIFQITVANKSLDMAVQLRDMDFNCSCCIIFQITVANKSLDMAVQLRDVDFNCSCCIIFQITVANKSLDMAIQLRDVDFNCSCCIIFQITVANKSLDMAVQLRDVDFNCSCCIIFQITVANKSLDMAVQLRDVDFNCSCCIIFQITVANKSLDMAIQLRDVDFNCSCCIIFQITVANKSLDMAVQLRDVDFNCSCCIIFQITVANKSLDMAVQLRDVDFNCSCCIIFQITVANKSLDMAVQLRDVDFNCSCCIIFQIIVANKSLDMAVQLRDVDFNCTCCIIFQITVANKSLDMAIQLRDMDLSIEDLKSTAMGILSAISSVSAASAFNLKSALRSEYKMDQLSPEFFNFDTNLESKQQDYKTSNKGEAEFLHTMNVHEKLQIETAKQIAQQQEKVRKVIEEVWAQKSLPGETDILRSPSFTMSLSNIAVDDIPGMTFQADAEPTTTPDPDVVTPMVKFTGSSTTDMFTKNQVEPGDHVSISVIATKNDAGRFAPNSDKLGDTSNFLSVSVTNTLTGFPVEVDDTRDDFIIMIPREDNKQNLFFKQVEPVLAPMSDLFLHKARITNKEASFHMEFDIADPGAQLLVIVNFGKKPNIETNECDFVGLIPKSMKNRDTSDRQQMMFFLNNHKVGDFIGDVYVGVRQLEKEHHDAKYHDCSALPPFNKSDALSAFRTNYSSRIFTSGCFFFDVPTQRWETNGLTVGPNTNVKVTECLSNHLTSFVGGWFVSPNTIDWDFVFSHADFYTNPTVYVTEVVIAFIYILAVVLARRKDKKDVEKLGLTPLKDNHPADKYYYEVIVFTGMRRNAGTDSKVFVIFSGENDETDARMLADDKRKVFRRGGVDGFLMAVRQPLGPLNYARIWHDNSGKGKFGSWFLKYIIVRDIQTDQKFILIANRWFAVEEDDGQVDRVVPVAGKEQMSEFSHLFTERSRKSLVDGHIWFSVMARPPQSRFTCVQRVSCCLCLLFTTMVANAMFYGIPQNDDSQKPFIVGPFALTPTQIFIGVISNLVVFPINFLIVTLFRKSRARTKRPSRIEAALKAAPTASVDDVKPELGAIWHTSKPFINTKTDGAISRPASACSEKSVQSVDGQTERRTTEPKQNANKKKKFELPWWFRIVAWMVLWLTTFTAAAFVTFYAIQFGDQKTKKWITSLLISFLTSVFVTQPVKVFLTAIFLSLIFKSPGEDQGEEPEDEEEPNLMDDRKLAMDEEYLHQNSNYGPARPRKIGYQPPERAELERAREERMKEIKMWDIIREITLYSFFLWILMVISYRQRSSNSFFYKDSIEKLFINNKDMKMSFMKIRNTEEFWKWSRTDLVNGLRASNYYNNYPPLMLRGYVGDKVSRIMGYATLRQLRVKPGKCQPDNLMKDVISSCTTSYTIFSEDTADYNVRWLSLHNTTNQNRPEYTYSKASKLNGYPYIGKLTVYGGGGYVTELRESRWVLRRMMSRLQQEQWVDKHTRGLFVELTVYNPQVNLFAIVTIIAEFSDTGGVVPSYRIEPAMLLPYMSSALLFQVLCEIVYFVFTVMFIFKEMKKLIQLKFQYFKYVWNLVELSIIAMSIAAIVVYFYKFIVTNQLTSQFKQNKGNKYMKFQYVGYWNEVFSYIIGWLVFFGSLKFLKLLRFNKRMSLLAATLRKGAKRLVHFSLIFWIVFLAFIQLFYLTFMSTALSFSSFVGSVETGVLMIMGQIDIFSMTMVLPIMSHIYVFLFVFTITFIVVNMFLSILNETFADVRADLTKMSNDYEILSFMLNRFKMWTGLWDAPEAKKIRIRRRKSRAYCSKTALAIEEFPDRIDRLLNSISNVYMEDGAEVGKSAAMTNQKMKLAKLMKSDEEPLFLDDISEGSKKD